MSDDPQAIAARMRQIEAERLRGLRLSFDGKCAKCGGKGTVVVTGGYGIGICDECDAWKDKTAP